MEVAAFESEFVARYQVRRIERIDRQFSSNVLAFPGGVPVDDQTELDAGPILAVTPATGHAWIGVFHNGEYGIPPAVPDQVVGWPDERSLCVVKGGAGFLVRTDDPTINSVIDAYPITNVLAIPDRDLVVFSDFAYLIAYGAEGVAWGQDESRSMRSTSSAPKETHCTWRASSAPSTGPSSRSTSARGDPLVRHTSSTRRVAFATKSEERNAAWRYGPLDTLILSPLPLPQPPRAETGSGRSPHRSHCHAGASPGGRGSPLR